MIVRRVLVLLVPLLAAEASRGVAQAYEYRGFRGGMTIAAFRSAVRHAAVAPDTLTCEVAVAGLQACGAAEIRLRPDTAPIGLVALLDVQTGVVPTILFRRPRPADSVLTTMYAALARRWGRPDGAAQVDPASDQVQWTRGHYNAKWQAAGANVVVIVTDVTAHARAQQRLDAAAGHGGP